jgi:hypothetical protein
LSHQRPDAFLYNFPGSRDWTVTRSYVAFVLCVNVSTVRRLEARAERHPQIGPGGIRSFDLHEVIALKSRRLAMTRDRTTEVRLAVFELFRQGVDWRDVAIRLRHDPFRVYRLWRLFAVDRRAGAANSRDA